jgi:molecular chaperone GrpE (heat shock protein)
MGVRLEGEAGTTPPSVEAEQSAQPEDAVRPGERDEAEAVLDRLDSRLAEAQRLLARQVDLTERLHTENQSLRAGELRGAQTPLIRDLIRLSDDLERMRAVGDSSAEDLALVHEGLLDVLARNGVEAFEPERGEPFDSGAHAAAAAEPTEDEQLDRTVAEVVRRGFRWDSGEVIRVAEVRAYRFLGSG